MLKKKASLFLFCLLGFTLMFSACASTNTSGGTNAEPSAKPLWIRDPYTKYDRQSNVAASGSANSSEMADKSALGNLVAIFGQSIQVDEKVSSSYNEAVKKGVTAKWSENTVVDTVITTSAEINSLVGAEILDRWDDGINFYAVAVLNKSKAIQTYSGIVNSNQTVIENLTNISPWEKYTLDGIARYQFAATIADMTAPYLNLLSLIGGAVPAFKRGDDYRLEAADICKAIPVRISVQNDKAGRIQGAFARALSDLGFSSGGNNSPYSLGVTVTTTPVVIVNSQNKFTRIELKADLKDINAGAVLFPYDFNSREGHTTQEEADNRAYISAERKINAEYAELLRNYLSQLLPVK